MPEPGDSSFDRDEALARLAEAIAAEIGEGRTLNLDALASRHGLPTEDARRVKEAVEALGLAIGEDEVPSLPLPSLPPDYEVLGEIGRGGMGVVYRVRQRSLGRTVALKVLRPGELFFGDAIRRFQKEAQSLARLRHRHIISIHDVGESGGHVYYTMDLIEGRSLAELIRDKEVTPTRALRLLRQVASAISHAHAQGIIHRDLKPANILVDPAGDAYVVDFGLARDAAVKGDLTTTGHLLGTPAYMSPEQARGDSARIGEATDVYSLGAVLYECLAGRAPFRGASLANLIHAVIHEDPPPPRRIAPKTPRDLEIICQKAMAKEPERRYATVRAMLEDLEHFEEGRPIRARRPSLAYRARRFAGRHAAPLAAGGITAGLLLCILLFFVVPQIGKTPETLLATAEELHAAGEHAGAVVLCERALQRNPSKDTAERIESAVLRCRLEVVRALEAQGRWPEAQALCEKMERLPGGDEDPEVLWELSRCLAKKGDHEGAGSLLESVKDGLERRHEKESPVDWDKPRSAPAPNMRVRMLERAAPALLDPQDPGHDGAGVLFVQSFAVWHRHDRDVDDWLLAQGDRAAEIVVALLPFLPRESLGADGGDLYESIAALPGRRLDAALIAAARDEARPLLARRFASDLLAARWDLPVWLGSWREKKPGGDDPVLVLRAATQAEELSAFAPAKGFRRRVEAAMKALEEGPHNDDYDVWWVSEWLSWHTGMTPKAREAAEHVREWKRWWQEHGSEDPVQWFSRALNLAVLPSQAELLDRYLRCPELDERTLLHQLLVLTAPDGTRIPLRRYSWGKREPTDRAMEWYRALRGSAPEVPYLLRMAHVVFRDGRPEPELQWQETRPIRIGEEFRTADHVETRLRPSQGLRLTTPGLQFERGTPLLEREWRRDSGGLKWRQGGLFFRFDQREEPQGILVVDNDLYQKEKQDEKTIRTDVTLAVVLAPGADSRDWTLADWASKMREDLKFLLEGIRSDAGNKGAPFYMRYQVPLRIYPQLAAHFALPEAANLLRELDDATRSHPFLGRDGDRFSWAPARLLAGDAATLARPDLRSTVEKASKETMSTTGYAARLVQSAKNPKIRDFALDLLRERQIPDGVCLAMAPRVRSWELAAPSWLAERVGKAETRKEAALGGPRLRNAVIAVGIGTVALSILVRALWPGLPYRRRLQPAALLIVVGLGMVAVFCELDGLDLLHDGVGYAFVAIGCALLTKGTEGWTRHLSTAFFGLAMVLVMLGSFGRRSYDWYAYATLAGAAGISTLPFLIHALDRVSVPRKKRKRWLLIAVFPFMVLVFMVVDLGSWIESLQRATRSLWEAIGILSYVVLGILFLSCGALYSAASGAARVAEEPKP